MALIIDFIFKKCKIVCKDNKSYTNSKLNRIFITPHSLHLKLICRTKQKQAYSSYKLIQRHIIKICLIAVGFLVVELVDSHVGVLDFLGTVAEGVGNMDFGGHYDNHLRCKYRSVYSLDPFGPYFKYSTHNDLF